MEGVTQVADPKYILEGCQLCDTYRPLNFIVNYQSKS